MSHDAGRSCVVTPLTDAKIERMVAAWRKVLMRDHEDTLALGAYNVTDIVTEAEASSRIPDLSPIELAYWQDDQAINRRGVAIDREGLDACCAIVEQAIEQYGREFHTLTGIDGPTKLQQFTGWLASHNVITNSLDDDAVEALLKRDLPPKVRRALEVRAAIASASVKKVFSMHNMLAADGRLHDLYIWAGARTGRPTGSGPQPTNLPKAGPPTLQCACCKRHHGAALGACPYCGVPLPPGRKADEWSPGAALDALAAIRTRSLAYVEHVFGPGTALQAVAGVLRGLFVAALGHILVSSDFSAIEGVVIAALANERWRLEVFASHGRIYEMSASKIMGIPFQEFLDYKARTGKHHPARQNPGKIAELGLGFGGWINAWRQFDGPGTDDEVKANILAWRDASPAIVYFWGGQKIRWDLHAMRCKLRGIEPHSIGWTQGQQWFGRPEMFGLEGAAIQAVQNPGVVYPVDRLDGTPTGVAYVTRGSVLYCTLPSGRSIAYHNPRLAPAREEWRGLSLSYEGWNSNPKNGHIGWITMNLYGGRAAENVVQAVARDIQMHAIRNCEADGRYPIVLHTYDEVVAEVPEGSGSVEELEARMMDLPAWARGWPIKATGGWMDPRYRKG